MWFIGLKVFNVFIILVVFFTDNEASHFKKANNTISLIIYQHLSEGFRSIIDMVFQKNKQYKSRIDERFVKISYTCRDNIKRNKKIIYWAESKYI